MLYDWFTNILKILFEDFLISGFSERLTEHRYETVFSILEQVQHLTDLVVLVLRSLHLLQQHWAVRGKCIVKRLDVGFNSHTKYRLRQFKDHSQKHVIRFAFSSTRNIYAQLETGHPAMKASQSWLEYLKIIFITWPGWCWLCWSWLSRPRFFCLGCISSHFDRWKAKQHTIRPTICFRALLIGESASLTQIRTCSFVTLRQNLRSSSDRQHCI